MNIELDIDESRYILMESNNWADDYVIQILDYYLKNWLWCKSQCPFEH